MKIDRAILMVDDEMIILLSLRQELRAKLGPAYRYEIARDADEGLKAIEELAADGVSVVLVISDWLMPGMRGDEFLANVRAGHPEVKTIMVSGHADEDQLERLRDSGALDAFFRKPWDPARLARECGRLLASPEAGVPPGAPPSVQPI
ncbi:MAG TPA: response regulator [Spirochaetia bacterium]|nr:response regulator [Spirochaetales bacterium]HRY72617.1 response regulator [Spirochaetia bacterium]